MKTNQKIALIIIPITILGGISVAVYLQGFIFSFQPENELDEISIETSNDILSTLNLPIVGFPDAPVTIIAFNDYQCKYCKNWFDNEYPQISKDLIETQKANIVFLDAILLGNDSVVISEATFCANEQKKYSEYQKILFNSQQKIDDWAKTKQLMKFAADLGLDQESFEECMYSGKYGDKILSNIDYAKNLGVDKIPVFKIINFEGKQHFLKGGISSTVFEEIVDSFQ